MKEIIYKCDNCGEEFSQEYFEGGHIDHCMNFAHNLHIICERDTHLIAQEIFAHGNIYRTKYDTLCRLNCFKTYCNKTNLQKKYDEVEKLVYKHIEWLEKLKVIRNEIYEKVKHLSYADKEYIGLQYQAFLSKWN